MSSLLSLEHYLWTLYRACTGLYMAEGKSVKLNSDRTLILRRGAKLGYPEKNLSEQSGEPTNSIYMRRRVWLRGDLSHICAISGSCNHLKHMKLIIIIIIIIIIVVPIVLGALGTVPLRLKGNLKGLGVDTSITLIQKSALLGSARIRRKVLEM